jgi:hypothetical protein
VKLINLLCDVSQKAGTLINKSIDIDQETNNATGTVIPQKIKIFFTVAILIEFSSFVTSNTEDLP